MQPSAQFDGSIPGIYDEALGPFLFHWSAKRLGALLRVPAGGRLLELACGTGIATEAMRAALPDDAEIVATDLSEPMLDEARRRRGDLPGITWSAADAQELPFDDASFDAVACQFGIMFFPEKADALCEALRVLRPGGQLLFSTWDSLAHNAPVRIAHEVLQSIFPDDPPSFLETPFGMCDPSALGALFTGAGAEDVEIEHCDHVIELPSARGPAYGLVCGNPGVLELQARGASLDEIVDAAEAAIAAVYGSAPMRAPLRAIFVNARAPRT